MTRILPRVLASVSGLALWLCLPSGARADDAKGAPEPGESGQAAEPAEPAEAAEAAELADPSQPALDVPGLASPRVKSKKARSSNYWVDDRSRPRLPYHGGVDVPEGYRVASHPNMGLLVAGITVTSTLWTVSTIAAIALDQRQANLEGDPNFDDAYWPMFIPVVGPFITIKTADSSGTGAAILGLNGVVQAGGIGMIIAGIAAPKIEIIPQKAINLAPMASADTVGLDISGEF